MKTTPSSGWHLGGTAKQHVVRPMQHCPTDHCSGTPVAQQRGRRYPLCNNVAVSTYLEHDVLDVPAGQQAATPACTFITRQPR